MIFSSDNLINLRYTSRMNFSGVEKEGKQSVVSHDSDRQSLELVDFLFYSIYLNTLFATLFVKYSTIICILPFAYKYRRLIFTGEFLKRILNFPYLIMY